MTRCHLRRGRKERGNPLRLERQRLPPPHRSRMGVCGAGRKRQNAPARPVATVRKCGTMGETHGGHRMKAKYLMYLILLFNFPHLYATNSLNATYNTDKVKISQFLCYYENLIDNYIKYSEMEEKFYQFYYLAESLLTISNQLDAQISFYSENGIAQLDIGKNTYLFVSASRENEVKSSAEDYFVTEDFNDSSFIISYVCQDLELQQPIKDFENKNLYSLRLFDSSKKISEDEIEDCCFFFLPTGEGQYQPNFELKGNDYYGFYFSECEAKSVQSKLQNGYGINSEIKNLPCDFNLINKAYFNISYSQK